MTDEEIIAEFGEQGLIMAPDDDGESIGVLSEALESLCANFEAISEISLK